MNVRLTRLSVALGALALVMSACHKHAKPDGVRILPPDTEVAPTPDKPAVKTPDQPKPPVKADRKPSPAKPAQPKYAPVKMGPYVPQVPGKRVARVSVPGPYVALTFDDGPSSANTPRILNILKAHGAHATFFVAGEKAVGNKGILARAAAEGHEIGAHTYSHINLNKSSDEKINSEMTRTNAIITEATGRRPVVMRPPYGATCARLVDKMYNEFGMSSILWDVDTQDWRHPGVNVVVSRAVNGARPGSIILVHDIHSSTADAIEGIVTGLQARGFKLVTVSELMRLGGKTSTPVPHPATPAPAPAGTPAEQGATPAVETPETPAAEAAGDADGEEPEL